MATHLENLEKILVFVLKETPAHSMVDDIFEDIKSMVEKHMLLSDVESFIALFKFAISNPYMTKGVKIGPEMIQTFIDRTYSGSADSSHGLQADRLYTYLKANLREGAEINSFNIERLGKALKHDRKPNLERLMEHVRTAMILKWLQGPLKDQLSETLKDNMIFFAAIYGQYRTNRMFNVDWHSYEIHQRDKDLITREYKAFEHAIREAIQIIRKSITQKPSADNYYEQFRVVFESLDNLDMTNKTKGLNINTLFKDKIIVSTALIYLQDEFVPKDTELKRLTQLFISLYYQYSDKHYYLDVLQKT